MNLMISLFSVLMLVFWPLSPTFAQPSTRDPKALLRRAASAIQHLTAISYSAESYMLGLEHFDGRVIMKPAMRGDVTLMKLGRHDPIGMKLAIRGEIDIGDATYPSMPICMTYDGQTVQKLNQAWRTVFTSDSTAQGRGLLWEGMGLILPELKSAEPLQAELAAPIVRDDGVAVVSGVACNVVYVEWTTNPAQQLRTRWFLGMQDGLPRRFEGSNISNGAERVDVLTLANVVANPPLTDSTFVLPVPPGFTVRHYAGSWQMHSLVGATAPEWTLVDPAGQPHALMEYRGRVVVLDFWATWCHPCVESMPKLQQLYDTYKERGVVVLGINVRETGDAIGLMRQQGYTYGLLLQGESVEQVYRVKAIPTLFVIGIDGTVLMAEVGLTPDGHDRLIRLLEAYLAEHHM